MVVPRRVLDRMAINADRPKDAHAQSEPHPIMDIVGTERPRGDLEFHNRRHSGRQQHG